MATGPDWTRGSGTGPIADKGGKTGSAMGGGRTGSITGRGSVIGKGVTVVTGSVIIEMGSVTVLIGSVVGRGVIVVTGSVTVEMGSVTVVIGSVVGTGSTTGSVISNASPRSGPPKNANVTTRNQRKLNADRRYLSVNGIARVVLKEPGASWRSKHPTNTVPYGRP
jgi:hypothetical protein